MEKQQKTQTRARLDGEYWKNVSQGQFRNMSQIQINFYHLHHQKHLRQYIFFPNSVVASFSTIQTLYNRTS